MDINVEYRKSPKLTHYKQRKEPQGVVTLCDAPWGALIS
jgi:hypothetical protein